MKKCDFCKDVILHTTIYVRYKGLAFCSKTCLAKHVAFSADLPKCQWCSMTVSAKDAVHRNGKMYCDLNCLLLHYTDCPQPYLSRWQRVKRNIRRLFGYYGFLLTIAGYCGI